MQTGIDLPRPNTDARSDSTALAVAIGGVACPVPYLMSVVALRMAAQPRPGRRSRQARIAVVLAVVTILAQTAVIALLIAGVIP